MTAGILELCNDDVEDQKITEAGHMLVMAMFSLPCRTKSMARPFVKTLIPTLPARDYHACPLEIVLYSYPLHKPFFHGRNVSILEVKRR